MESLTTERALAYLQTRSTTNGDSIMTHLTHLIQTIIDARPTNAIDMLETSLLLKQTRLIIDERPSFPLSWKEKNTANVRIFRELFSTIPKALVGIEEEDESTEESSSNKCEITNLLSDSAYFEAVGVGLGHTETYLLVLTLKQLAETAGVITARFFGKFFGTSSNYYVFETDMDPQDKVVDDKDEMYSKGVSWGRPSETIPIEKGEGANSNVFWVCSKPGEKLYRLPDVTPLQIKTARSLKKFFTGNLNAEVSSYPPFPGLEENFLRAQIARIAATTVVVPKGMFKIPEAEDEEASVLGIVREEEWVTPSSTELGSHEAWVHKNPYLTLQGRCSLYVAEHAEEDQEVDDEEDQKETVPSAEEQEAIPERLTAIEGDANTSEGLKPWSFIFSSTLGGLKHQIVCVRSLVWPGAYTVATPTGISNIYVGWGSKNVVYVPPSPPSVLKEYDLELVESKELPPLPKSKEPLAGEQEEDQEVEQGEDEEDE